ncbi:hypothetical protein M407DRAFT_173397 [Tulasnella calospora MUT 4182]|uniref:Uncharacterized protein n=1 Tax=Tulasnella calospora MUT 4182 TaxID=1051891 RepID=A0A0C3Q3T2_9AGAM|nr:hypothetical protein M407DRAFT_173397 [Tulasnella calospora MUT 4182]
MQHQCLGIMGPGRGFVQLLLLLPHSSGLRKRPRHQVYVTPAVCTVRGSARGTTGSRCKKQLELCRITTGCRSIAKG